MQLKIDVLPAPLGPITANSSPGRTSNETASSAVTPPNRSVTSSTASSGSAGARHHVAVGGDGQRHRRVLLDEQHADALAVELDDRVAHLLDQPWREPER